MHILVLHDFSNLHFFWLIKVSHIFQIFILQIINLQIFSNLLFQARQILEGEFERLVSEGTDRQLGVPSDGRNSSADSIGGSIGDRSISPIS